mgnify:CR=1 FL=1
MQTLLRATSTPEMKRRASLEMVVDWSKARGDPSGHVDVRDMIGRLNSHLAAVGVEEESSGSPTSAPSAGGFPSTTDREHKTNRQARQQAEHSMAVSAQKTEVTADKAELKLKQRLSASPIDICQRALLRPEILDRVRKRLNDEGKTNM